MQSDKYEVLRHSLRSFLENDSLPRRPERILRRVSVVKAEVLKQVRNDFLFVTLKRFYLEFHFLKKTLRSRKSSQHENFLRSSCINYRRKIFRKTRERNEIFL